MHWKIIINKQAKKTVRHFHMLKFTETKSIHTVHDNEAEGIVIGQQRSERLGMELVVAEVQRCVDGLKRFKIDVHFLLLPFIR